MRTVSENMRTMARQKAFVLSPSPVQQYKKYDLENGPAEELRGPPEEFRYLYITKKRGGMQVFIALLPGEINY